MEYCPEWLFEYCVAQTAADFLSAELPIEAHAKKYAKDLSETYNDVDAEMIELAATGILEFLSEIKVGEDAIDYLIQFCWFSLNFENHRAIKRKRKSMLSTCFDPVKELTFSADKSVKSFKAYLYADRSNVLPKMPTGWKLADEADVEPLTKMTERETSVMDML